MSASIVDVGAEVGGVEAKRGAKVDTSRDDMYAVGQAVDNESCNSLDWSLLTKYLSSESAMLSIENRRLGKDW